jgi:hypothetical protein
MQHRLNSSLSKNLEIVFQGSLNHIKGHENDPLSWNHSAQTGNDSSIKPGKPFLRNDLLETIKSACVLRRLGSLHSGLRREVGKVGNGKIMHVTVEIHEQTPEQYLP